MNLATTFLPPPPTVPAWAVMWSLAGSIYLLCKVWTLSTARTGGAPAPSSRIACYLFLWPGMNAASFLTMPGAPIVESGLAPVGKALLGALLLWGGVRLAPTPILAGWLGMIGLILILHFGLFGLLSAAWQRAGYRAPALMQQPLLSRSPSDFWGRRWNTAFHDLVATCLLPPLQRRFGFAGATLAIFVGSGLVHDFVISLPAGGGYGLPTLYFTGQGGAVLLERSRFGRRLGLRGGWRGRLLLFAVAALPLGAHFHVPFVRQVILPFLHAIHAL